MFYQHSKPYSPDLNPIEQVFAKLKTLLRRAAPTDTSKAVGATWQTPRPFCPRGVPELHLRSRYCGPT
jgi:hypothetical protein